MKGPMRRAAITWREALLKGTVVAIDPGSIIAGYAVFSNQELKVSGTFKFPKVPIMKRLAAIHHTIVELRNHYSPDVFVIEQLRSTASNGRSDSGEKLFKHYTPFQLLLAVGAIGAALEGKVMEIPTASWRTVAKRLGLPKSDENDAKCLGMRAIELANEELQSEILLAKRKVSK